MTSTATTVRIRPRRSLVVTAFFSIVLAMIPVFGVLYWFAGQHGSWMPVLVVHLAVTAMSIAVLLRQLTVYTEVTATELVGRGIFSPLLRVPLSSIARVDIVPCYVGQSPDAVQQLLVRDDSGRRLFRMRGNFWHAGDLKAVVDALPVRATVVKEPMSIREFYRDYPGSAYWFENRRAMWIVVIVVLGLLAVAGAAWIMTILGMRVAFLPN